MNSNIYVILYVDDIVIITRNITTMTSFKTYLNEIKFFLGIRVERKNDKLTLDQTSYLRSILIKYNMYDCKSVTTQMPAKLDYQTLFSDKYYEAPCKNLIGNLMYAMFCTRPDICAAFNILSRYHFKNNLELWKCLYRVLRYMKGSINLKVTYEKRAFTEIIVFLMPIGAVIK